MYFGYKAAEKHDKGTLNEAILFTVGVEANMMAALYADFSSAPAAAMPVGFATGFIAAVCSVGGMKLLYW